MDSNGTKTLKISWVYENIFESTTPRLIKREGRPVAWLPPPQGKSLTGALSYGVFKKIFALRHPFLACAPWKPPHQNPHRDGPEKGRRKKGKTIDAKTEKKTCAPHNTVQCSTIGLSSAGRRAMCE